MKLKLKEFLKRADDRTNFLDVVAVGLFALGSMTIYFSLYYKLFGDIGYVKNLIIGVPTLLFSIWLMKYSVKQDELENPKKDIKVWDVKKWGDEK